MSLQTRLTALAQAVGADIKGLYAALAGKVDKVAGKGLSTNDYSSADKAKVAGLGTAAAANLTTSKVDTTAGRVLKVGDFGIGINDLSIICGPSAKYHELFRSSKPNGWAHAGDDAAANYPIGIFCSSEGRNEWFFGSGHNDGNLYYIRQNDSDASPVIAKVVHTGKVQQSTGGDTEFPMSQAATTNALNNLRPGPWIDLRPYLNPALIYDPARAGKNNFPAGRVNNGFIELRGVVNYNVSAAAPASGVMLTLPPELRPAMTTGLVGFVEVASPLYFGYATYIVVGATPYNMPGAQHGELRIVNMPGGPTSVTTQSFPLDGLRFAQG